MASDPDSWQRTVYEALRPIDARGLFNVRILEFDLPDAGGRQHADFPSADLAAFVDSWLAQLEPDADACTTDWEGGGVRLVLEAKGRGPTWRGWVAIPSFNMLQPVMRDFDLVSGRRRFIDLTLLEVEQLASGELQEVGIGPSHRETLSMLADQMRHFGCDDVAAMPAEVITSYASMLGVIPAPP